MTGNWYRIHTVYITLSLFPQLMVKHCSNNKFFRLQISLIAMINDNTWIPMLIHMLHAAHVRWSYSKCSKLNCGKEQKCTKVEKKRKNKENAAFLQHQKCLLEMHERTKREWKIEKKPALKRRSNGEFCIQLTTMNFRKSTWKFQEHAPEHFSCNIRCYIRKDYGCAFFSFLFFAIWLCKPNAVWYCNCWILHIFTYELERKQINGNVCIQLYSYKYQRSFSHLRKKETNWRYYFSISKNWSFSFWNWASSNHL